MPRIYVADLAAYNAGYLHGEWIDLEDLTLDDVHERVQAILTEGTKRYAKETLSVHEEWAIHDYEGFGPIRVGEYDSLETIVTHVENMGDEPGKYFAWIAARGESEGFDPDKVHGPYESESDYVDQWIDNVYGSIDLEDVLVKAGVDRRVVEGLSALIEWRDTDAILRDWDNPLTRVEVDPLGSYRVDYYEVEA